MADDFRLGKLTRREFRSRMAGGELKACIIPIAAVEQHLEHLAMEHDWRSVCEIAFAVARRLSPHVIIAEGVMAGVSEHHMNHPGTLTLRPGTFLSIVEDLIDSLLRAGFRNVLVLNGHGGNIAPLQGAWDQILRRHEANLHFLSYYELFTPEDAKVLASGDRIPHDLPGHAQEFETSFALSRFPENVRAEALDDQPDPTPAMAKAKTGEVLFKRIVDRVAEFVTEMIDGERVSATPPRSP